MSHKGENTDRIYVPNDTSANITTWTFNWVSGSKSQYKLSTVVNNSVKYLKMDSTGLHMVGEDEASTITVSVGSGIVNK